jgi:hypothetical protein
MYQNIHLLIILVADIVMVLNLWTEQLMKRARNHTNTTELIYQVIEAH